MAKLYVGNLPYSTTEQELIDLFSPFGKVNSAIIINDRYSGRSKGFGFVEMENDEDSNKAMEGLKGKKLGDREVIISPARPREERPAGGGFQRGGNDFRDNKRGGHDRNRR